MALTSKALTRRSLLAVAALSVIPGGAAFAIETTFGSKGGNPLSEPQGDESVDFMRLTLPNNHSFAAREALLLTDAGAWFGALKGKTVRRDEDKIGIVKDIPFVGGLFSERLREKDFDPSLMIGRVFRVEEVLVVDLHLTRVTTQALAQRLLAGERPKESLRLPGGAVPGSLITANQSVSYHVPAAALSAVDPAKPPAALRSLADNVEPLAIGEAYRHAQGHILTLVRPSLLTGWS